MFTVALVGPEALGTRVARELVHRLPVPAVHLREGPLPDSSNRLPPGGWLLRLLAGAVSGSRSVGVVRRFVGWWYRRAGFIVILHGSAEVEGWRSGGWRSSAAPGGAAATPEQPPMDLVVVLDVPSPPASGLTRLRAPRSRQAWRRGSCDPGAPVVVVDGEQPIDRLVDEIERPIRSRAARHLVPVESLEPTASARRAGRGGAR